MITEYTKPWNSSKVWIDSDKPYTVVLKISGDAVYKFDEWYDVEFICRHFNIDPREIDEVAEALQKAFKELDKMQHPFLCPSCEHKYILHTYYKSAQYSDSKYVCKTKKPKKSKFFGVGFVLEDGPGGWDGKSCPNYIKDPSWVDLR